MASFVASLAKGHDDLGARIRMVTHSVKSKDERVKLHAHFLAFREGQPTISEFVDILSYKLVTFLTLSVPKLHVRMAAISLKWMRGEPLPEIIDENHKRKGGKISSSIRGTLNDIEQEIRFKYLRLTSCYIAILAHVLKSTGHSEYLGSLSSLPSYLEMGASDQTMISFINLGVSRMTARMLADLSMDKEMGPAAALQWLKSQNIQSIAASLLVRADIERALANAAVS